MPVWTCFFLSKCSWYTLHLRRFSGTLFSSFHLQQVDFQGQLCGICIHKWAQILKHELTSMNPSLQGLTPLQLLHYNHVLLAVQWSSVWGAVSGQSHWSNGHFLRANFITEWGPHPPPHPPPEAKYWSSSQQFMNVNELRAKGLKEPLIFDWGVDHNN